ncbi:MAG: bifunctional [glutamine synthetase] adenylyltransferase/[glutamine synthetase]-adenylyl-L-tyrosine phosphorylase [Aquiluna sp.]
MIRGRSNPLSELARLGFENLSETVAKLERLVELVGDWGHSALTPLASSASPDKALDFLLRMSEKKPKAIAKILSDAKQAERLCRVVGASDGMAEHLLRHPDSLSISKKPILQSKFTIPTASRSELRVGCRNALFQIIDWDLAQLDASAAFADVSISLTRLTDATLESAISVATQELFGEGRISETDASPCPLAVIAMGKTGAQELNYVSDVDVIYVATEAEKIDTAIKIATRMQAVVYDVEVEPGLWQVDPNLRPEGKSGVLVRTLEAHVAYYDKWAEPWEFQALLKARFAAGNAEIGNAYIDTIKPMIWAYQDRSAIVDSARHLRKRVLENIPPAERSSNLKLGRGGLRDVEFTAQLLQLVHGVGDPSLQVMDTLSALEALSDAGLLSRTDRAKLSAHYRFLRSVEHRIQLQRLRRSHLVPNKPEELRRVARGLGLSSDELTNRLESVRAEVAELHDSVFYRPLLAATAALTPGEIRLSAEDVEKRLVALGFVDPKGALNHINALTTGVSRSAVIQRTLLPVLIRWMAEGTDPDRALVSFRRLSEELGETPWFLRMLRDSSGAAERLMRVLSSSGMIARVLERIPDSTSWFGDDTELSPRSLEAIEAEMAAIISRQDDPEAAADLIRNIRRRETLRVAIGAVLGVSSMPEISEGLTAIMDAYLRAMLEIAKEGQELDLGIVAMGRLGGRELGFGSDADAMLVYGSGPEVAQGLAEKVTSRLLSLVKDSIMAFELDLGLRPEGKNGPRVRSLESYRAYFEKWADTWEFQALLRARVISGSPELVASFTELIDRFRYPVELTNKQLVEIRRIKARVEAERLPQGADPARHLKLGKGSISDVEWLVQLYQLRLAHKQAELRVLGTLEALAALEKSGEVSREDGAALRAAWLLSSRCRSALVLAVDKLLDILPTDRRQLEAMARILELPPGSASDLEETYLSSTRKARAVYEQLFAK